MGDNDLNFREVIPDQTLVEKWKEITLNTGGRQSTLQDIKVAERASGYCYKDSTKSYTRNRFIYWRISHDVLEIVEQSLDVSLSGNGVRYRFIDTPILDGITIHETCSSVVVLIPTVCSVHRLVFPHPDRIHKQDDLLGSHPDIVVQSILTNASQAQVQNPSSFHIFTNPSNAGSQLPHCAASWLNMAEDEAFFLLAYPSGDILMIRQEDSGLCDTMELKFDSLVPRFLYGLAEKFRSKSSDGNVVISMVLHTIGLETYALTLCRNGHLRVWSCTKGQCIAVSDILLETAGGHNLAQGAQNHIIRKAVGGNETDFVLTVVLNLPSESQFHVLKPTINGTQFRIVRINTLHSPGVDLVDFSLSMSRIWSVWRAEDGECSVYSAALSTGGGKGSHWMPVVLESVPNEVPQSSNMDPRQIYVQYIFHPGRFSTNIIAKALSIYKKSTILSEVNVSSTVLKQRVCMAVENEIQAQLQECEVSDEEYLECANWCWSNFYSCCIQYHVTGLRPLGILLLPSVSGAILLKKSTYSLLRPLDVLEHLFLCHQQVTRDQFLSQPHLSISSEEIDDLLALMNVLVYLEEQLSDLFKSTFENEMSKLKSPDVVMAELITELIMEMSEEFTYSVIERLENCHDVYRAMHKVLELLRLEQQLSEVQTVSQELQSSINYLFTSELGKSFVSQCLKQQANVRFSICRNLLCLQNIILERREERWNFFEAIRSVCMPEVVVLIQAYYTLVWLSDLPAMSVVSLESSMQKLAPLKLAPVFNLKSGSMQIVSLLDLFLGSSGGFEAHKSMSKSINFDIENLPYWNTSLLLYLEHLMLILWPVNGSVLLAEWLLSSGQHVRLQQYVRYLNNWCEWDNLSRNFLLGAAFLTSGEHHKAYDLFLVAARGVHSEEFLQNRISNYATGGESNPYILYFLKVIQLFELHGARNYAIDVANTALSVVDVNDPLKATLYSIKFKHHLALAHYNKAYDSLNSNPDTDRKKDNLRDLVKTLLDQKQLDTLMSFPYVGMEELFCSILFTRARATDTVNNIYYDFLYSYQIQRGPPYFRLAASVMCEQAFRLTQQRSVKALEKQVKCYLASVNAFNLCDPQYAWVLRPADPNLKAREILLPPRAGSRMPPQKIKLNAKQIDVVDLADIRKELAMASARLRLAKFNVSTLAYELTLPKELVTFLSRSGLFKTALSLCTTFDLHYDPVFEHLTYRCISLTAKEDPGAWNWLVQNDLHDMPFIGNKPSSVAWKLLKTYLGEYEEEKMSRLHRVICLKMLNMGVFIPHWLLESYKKRNAAELLRLYLFHGYLRQASRLAYEHISAVLDHGGEYFGYTNSLVPGVAPFCLPVHTINALIYELELQNDRDEKKPLLKEYEKLREIFIKYLETSARISNDMCRSQLAC